MPSLRRRISFPADVRATMTFKTPTGIEFQIADDWWQFADMDRFSRDGKRCYPTGTRTGIELVQLSDVEPPSRLAGIEAFKKYKMTSLLMALSSPECAIPPIEVTRLPAGQPYRYRVTNGFHRYYLSAAVGFPMVPIRESLPVERSRWSSAELPAIYCADIGSVAAGNFGWCGKRPNEVAIEDNAMGTLVEAVAADLAAERPVALGFECPLFVPLNDQPTQLTMARLGEGNRAWSAGAGCGALATGLVQVAWLLRAVRERLDFPPIATVDWSLFAARGSGLFLWEAFVTSTAKRGQHSSDARAAVEAFQTMLESGDWLSDITCAGECYSLIGAALLRSGWSDDVALTEQPCTVVRAMTPTT